MGKVIAKRQLKLIALFMTYQIVNGPGSFYFLAIIVFHGVINFSPITPEKMRAMQASLAKSRAS
jgi:hypothetical protein